VEPRREGTVLSGAWSDADGSVRPEYLVYCRTESAQGVIHHARQLDRGAGRGEALRGVSRCDEVPHQPIGQAAGGSDQRRAELTGNLAKMSWR
jgi:hypothetical protein